MSDRDKLTIDEFRTIVKGTEIGCKLCGHKDHSIVKHVLDRHTLSAGQYKKQFPDARLCSPIVSELLRRMDRKSKKTTALTDFVGAFQLGGDIDLSFKEAMKKLPKVDPANAHLIPKKTEHFRFPQKETEAILTALILEKNVYVEGPTGCGKTDLLAQVLNRLDRPMKRANMNGEVTRSNFLGGKVANQQRGTYFQYGSLPLAMRGGYPLLVDEVDYTPPHIASVLNPVLEGGRKLYIDEIDEEITAKEGFLVMATANTGGKGDKTGVYTGTEVLNTSFLDRFSVKLKADYLDRATECSMLADRFPKEPTKDIETMVKGAEEIRVAFQQGNLSLTLSTRKLIDYFELKDSLGPQDSLKVSFLNWVDEDDLELVSSQRQLHRYPLVSGSFPSPRLRLNRLRSPVHRDQE